MVTIEHTMEFILSVIVGIGLSAACGFRIFVPFLIIGIANRAGHLELATPFQWIAGDYAIGVFAVATLIEIIAYYSPVMDNALDTLATPAAVIAGTVITAAVVTDVSPALRWTLAIIAGGASSMLVQSTTAVTRAASLTSTAGFGNPLVSTAELFASVTMSMLALSAPFIAIAMVIIGSMLAARCAIRRKRGRPEIPVDR